MLELRNQKRNTDIQFEKPKIGDQMSESVDTLIIHSHLLTMQGAGVGYIPDGAVVVKTPQLAAVNVAARGARMFEKVNVPIKLKNNYSWRRFEKSAAQRRRRRSARARANGFSKRFDGAIYLEPNIWSRSEAKFKSQNKFAVNDQNNRYCP